MRWNLSLAALAASWGFIDVIVAHVRIGAGPVACYRVTIAAIAIALGLAAVGRLRVLAVPEARGLLVLVGVVLAVHWYLFFETIKLGSVAVAVVTVYTAPLLLALLAPLFLPERRSRVVLTALVPGAAGIVLIALAGEGGTHARPLAIATGLGAGLAYAFLVIGTKKLTPRLDTLTIQFWQAAIAAVALAPTLLLGGHTVPHGGDIGFVVLLGTLFTAVTCSAYVWLLHRVTAQAAGVLSYLEPVSASLLAWALLGQHIGWAVVFGGALVLGAGFLVVWYEPPDTAALERAGRRLPAPEPAVAPSRGA